MSSSENGELSRRDMFRMLARLAGMGAIAGLAGCNFTRVHNISDQTELWGRVELPDANDSESYAIRRILAGYFGEPINPAYRLTLDYSSSMSTLAITQTSVTTRYRITASGRFLAERLGQSEPLLDQKFKRVASYSANEDRFAADQARVATQERLARVVADEFAVRFISAANRSEAGGARFRSAQASPDRAASLLSE